MSSPYDTAGPTYTTAPGESLAGIALRELRDESRWTEIRDLNEKRFPYMASNDYYPVGTVLRMPDGYAPRSKAVDGDKSASSAEPQRPDMKALCEAAARAGFEFPKLPAGIVRDPRLGDLFDRLQAQQYGLRVAEALLATGASQRLGPFDVPGLVSKSNFDEGVVELRFVDDVSAQAFMERYQVTVDSATLPAPEAPANQAALSPSVPDNQSLCTAWWRQSAVPADEHPAARRGRERFEAEHGELADVMTAVMRWRQATERFGDLINRDREKPTTEADVDAARDALHFAIRRHAELAARHATTVQRTAIEQYDLEQSADYRKGREDGRLAGYEVGLRHAVDNLRGLDTSTRVRFYEHDFYVLSNFSSFNLKWKGHVFATSEHAYHWEKFSDPDGSLVDVRVIRHDILTAPSAHEAFKIAERNKAHRRPDWDDVKVGIMREILRAKVEQHEYVRRKLLATGDRELVEDSWRDDFWGWGEHRNGLNTLGRLWMELRAELRADESPSA